MLLNHSEHLDNGIRDRRYGRSNSNVIHGLVSRWKNLNRGVTHASGIYDTCFADETLLWADLHINGDIPTDSFYSLLG